MKTKNFRSSCLLQVCGCLILINVSSGCFVDLGKRLHALKNKLPMTGDLFGNC